MIQIKFLSSELLPTVLTSRFLRFPVGRNYKMGDISNIISVYFPKGHNGFVCVGCRLFYKIIIIIFLHGLGRLTCSGIYALPSFPGASTIPSSPGFVCEGVFLQDINRILKYYSKTNTLF
jgi:hypothetical protein